MYFHIQANILQTENKAFISLMKTVKIINVISMFLVSASSDLLK